MPLAEGLPGQVTVQEALQVYYGEKICQTRFLVEILSKSIDFERQAGPGVSGRFGTSGGSHFRHFLEIIVIQNHRSGRNSDTNLGIRLEAQ